MLKKKIITQFDIIGFLISVKLMKMNNHQKYFQIMVQYIKLRSTMTKIKVIGKSKNRKRKLEKSNEKKDMKKREWKKVDKEKKI